MIFKEGDVSVTTPDIFGQCEYCPVAMDIVNYWLKLRSSSPTVASKKGKITIECEEKDGGVLLEEKTRIVVTHNDGQPKEVFRSEIENQHPVSCPHFNGGRPVAEPE